MQFYIYDFSEFMDLHLEDHGRYSEYLLSEYWSDPSRYPYLIKLSGKNAGFVLVRLIREGEQLYYSIVEFFIMKRYRRAGLGNLVAKDIFTMHKGNWTVHQIINNLPAQLFWQKTINEYTGGKYTERTDEKKVTQIFVSGA